MFYFIIQVTFRLLEAEKRKLQVLQKELAQYDEKEPQGLQRVKFLSQIDIMHRINKFCSIIVLIKLKSIIVSSNQNIQVYKGQNPFSL